MVLGVIGPCAAIDSAVYTTSLRCPSGKWTREAVDPRSGEMLKEGENL
jgi:hypothetical protein